MVSAYSEHDGKSSAEEESFSTGFRAQSASGSDGYRAQQRRAVPILRQLIANGYQPLTIVPPAAEPPGFLEGKPREQFLDARGKAPGWYDGGRWGNLPRWRSWHPCQAHFDQIATWPLAPNIGLITGDLLGADIDVRDPDLARHILAEGQSAPRRRSASCRPRATSAPRRRSRTRSRSSPPASSSSPSASTPVAAPTSGRAPRRSRCCWRSCRRSPRPSWPTI
jgi:hypothetical protein